MTPPALQPGNSQALSIRGAILMLLGQAIGSVLPALGLTVWLHRPPDHFIVPFLLLCGCALPLPILIHWTRAARTDPKSFALRSAITCWAYINELAIALGLGGSYLSPSFRETLFPGAVATASILSIVLGYMVYRNVLRRAGIVGV